MMLDYPQETWCATRELSMVGPMPLIGMVSTAPRGRRHDMAPMKIDHTLSRAIGPSVSHQRLLTTYLGTCLLRYSITHWRSNPWVPRCSVTQLWQRPASNMGVQLPERGIVAVRGPEAYDSASLIHASCLSVGFETRTYSILGSISVHWYLPQYVLQEVVAYEDSTPSP